MTSQTKRTPLYSLHLEHGAKIVPFAGYEMPVNYADGIIKEHLHTRQFAGLFDVSHMGQISIHGKNTAAALEALIPVDILSLAPGRQKYGLLTNPQGGIIDDLMIQNLGDRFILVVNAACKQQDFAHLCQCLGDSYQVEFLENLALVALQGPAAATVLAAMGHELTDMKFMDVRQLEFDGITCSVSRSGYTGEDGFEMSVAADQAEQLARLLLADQAVKMIGLGARDSLRLEAGLCLYGHDITTATSPIEAGLNWAISPVRRQRGERAGGFPGDDTILPQIPKNISRLRVGLTPLGRAPVREGSILLDDELNPVGEVSSGGFSPSLGHPVSMGYVKLAHAAPGTKLQAQVRNRNLPVEVTRLPFVANNFYR